jgi:putative PIN family toxin of toxin-antitoxin system
VFDTNVLVSALVFSNGRAAAALDRLIDGRDQLVFSKPIMDELLTVLARKFSRDADELARVALLLAELGEIVTPRDRLALLHDAPDNRILECAVTAGADAIVTGDKAMLKLGHVGDTRIISLRRYLAT